MQHNPTRPDPARPGPARPGPTRPDPTRPDPTRPDPTRPDPTRPDPTRPGPARPDPTRPDPTRPDPARPDPTRPDPTRPDPTRPDPTRPAPPRPAPPRPAPTRPDHAMRQVFESSETEAIILVDATNAFNSLNRQAALRNIRHSSCSEKHPRFLSTPTGRMCNCLLMVRPSLLSQEGTTEGDPLAMVMYAIAVNPLIHRLKHDTRKQIWFADDATAGGKLNNLQEWWDCLIILAQSMATSRMHQKHGSL